MVTDIEGGLPKHHGATQNEKLVIAASSLGTVFEWYDFYLYVALNKYWLNSKDMDKYQF